MPTRIQLRRGTAAQWASANPTLAGGEAGVETDTGQVKFGDGVTAWTDLPYTTDNATTVVQTVYATTDTATETTSTDYQDTALAGSITPKHDDSVIEVTVIAPQVQTRRVAGSPELRAAFLRIRNETDNAVLEGAAAVTVGHRLASGSSANANAFANAHMTGRYTVDSLAQRTFRAQIASMEAANLEARFLANAATALMIIREVRA